MNSLITIEMFTDGKSFIVQKDGTLVLSSEVKSPPEQSFDDASEDAYRSYIQGFLHDYIKGNFSLAKLLGTDKHFGLDSPYAGRALPEDFPLPAEGLFETTWFTDAELMKLNLDDMPAVRYHVSIPTTEYDFNKTFEENIFLGKHSRMSIGRTWSVTDWEASGRKPSLYDFIVDDAAEKSSQEIENFKNYVENLRQLYPGATFRFVLIY